mmetsp:Transcript_79256/g.208161  ORF Transcript_79256/g.208161 Transcript_79256/m.208161 type:complete len:297 (-) Transcript_79256:16-906(-)
MLDHLDPRLKVEDELVAQGLLRGLPPRHLRQRVENLRRRLHRDLLRLPRQRAVGQDLERHVEDDAEAPDGHRRRHEVVVPALDAPDRAVVRHDVQGQQVLRVALPEVVAARRDAAADRVRGVPGRHAQGQALLEEHVLQVAHLHPGPDGRGVAAAVEDVHLALPEVQHVNDGAWRRVPLRVGGAHEGVEAVARGAGPHGLVLADDGLHLLERPRPLDDHVRAAAAVADPVHPVGAGLVLAEHLQLRLVDLRDGPREDRDEQHEEAAAPHERHHRFARNAAGTAAGTAGGWEAVAVT